MAGSSNKNLERAKVSSFRVGLSENKSSIPFNRPGLLNQIALTPTATSAEEAAMDHYVRAFTPSRAIGSVGLSALRFSRKFDMYTINQNRVFGRRSSVRVDTAYKRKAVKVRPVNSDQSDGTIPGGIADWKAKALEKERGLPKSEKFPDWLIPKFSTIFKGSRLTPERLQRMTVGDSMTSAEKEVLTQMLYNREAALSWEFSEMGRVKPEVSPPCKINTIPHEAWQTPSFPLPRALVPMVIEMLKDRLQRGTLEPCHGPYRNPWFIVKKKEKNKYRLINAALDMNKVTIRDANLPPSVDEFSEDFAGCHIASLIDLFSGYDQMELDVHSRDMTAFMTPIGLLRMTSIPMGATNSVAQFVRVVTKILQDHIPNRAKPFLDDIGVKGPKTDYGGEEVAPGIRKYVLEHLMWLDGVLADIERAGCTISGEKSQFCMAGLKIVGFVTDSDGRHPDTAKVIKILEWPICTDASSARAFIGVCVYYRIWILDFAIVAEPIYRLLKKDAAFVWGMEQTEAMDLLKIALTSPPALKTIDYSELAGLIILAVDASLKGWGAVLMQIFDGKRHPIRYESGVWSEVEQRYDATKRECRGVLKALKKTRHWLYGVHFVLETDANVLVAQLNGACTDLPGALIVRWIAWIRLFDFEVKHVAGRKHTAADGLSRRPHTEEEIRAEQQEQDIDDFIDAELNSLRACPISVNSAEVPDEKVLKAGYSDKSERIAAFLTSLQKPVGLNRKEFRAFKSEALRYRVQDGHLYRRNSKNVPSRRVIDSDERKLEILKQLHDESGHRGREGTYRRIADRYWWEQLHDDVKGYVRSCEECQKRDPTRLEEALHPTWVTFMWQKVGLDVVHMPACRGKHYIVMARDDFSGWVEGRALGKATAQNVARFLWEDVICRHGCFGKLIVDGGPENKDAVIELANRYGIKRVVVSAYHPQANGMIERGHRPVVQALSKMTNGGMGKWVDNLPAVLWADRTTVRASTGNTPFYLNSGNEAVLPIELEIPTWRILPWNEVHTTDELLAMRARQIQRRDEDMEETALFLQRQRMEGKETFDTLNNLRSIELTEGQLILLHDTKLDNQHTGKLTFRWLGPYKIQQTIVDKGTYKLCELDGTLLAGTFAGNRLKPFHARQNINLPPIEEPEQHNSQGPTINHGGDEDDRQSMIPPGWPMAVVIPSRRADAMETVEN